MEVNIRQFNIGNINTKAAELNIPKKIMIETIKGKREKIFYYARFDFPIGLYAGNKVHRIGYCCSPLAIDLPIFLNFSGGGSEGIVPSSTDPYYVRPNGILEIMVESFRDINQADNSYEETLVPQISLVCDFAQIWVPYKYEEQLLPFTIDFLEYVN